MQRTDVAAAVNARIVPIVEYGTDPRGWRLFTRLTGWARRGMGPANAVVDPHPQFSGPVALHLPLSGMAPLGSGRPVVETSSQMTNERADGIDSSAMRVFAARLARGRSS